MSGVRRTVLAAAVAVGLMALAASPALAATTWTVTTTSDGTGSCTGTSCTTLRAAVGAASAGDTISLPAQSSHYMVTEGQITITQPVTIVGAGANSSVVDAGSTSRVFEVDIPGGGTVTLKDLTVTGGSTTSYPGGGGVYVVYQGSSSIDTVLDLVGADVTGNQAKITVGNGTCCSGGGGIYNDGGDVNLSSGSSVSNNAATVTGPSTSSGTASPSAGGGGIYDNGEVTVSASKVDDNTATVHSDYCCHGGGGIYENADDVTVENHSDISGNTFSLSGPAADEANTPCCSGGGAIYQDSDSVRIVSSTLNHNTTKVNAAGCCYGGAVYMDTGGSNLLEIAGSTLDNNTTTVTGPAGADADGTQCCSGGGAVATFAETAIAESTLNHNTSSVSAGDCCQGGGAIQIDSKYLLDVISSDISQNTSKVAGVSGVSDSGGGGIFEDTAQGNDYTNSTLFGNTTNVTNVATPQGGGAIYANTRSGTSPDVLANVTLAHNSAPHGTGGGVLDDSSTVEFKNSIVALNTAAARQNCGDFTSPSSTAPVLDSLGYNLENSPDTCGFTKTGDRVVAAALIRLGLLAANGGPTETEALLSGSPAINGGNPAGCSNPFGTVLHKDQRNFPRPSGSRCDIGAYELQNPRLLTVGIHGKGSVKGGPILCPHRCSAFFPNGAMTKLTATPASGMKFLGWSGACTGVKPCKVKMTANKAVKAKFGPK